MSLFRRTAAEIHRRSLWQLLGIYVATGWGSLEFTSFIVEQLGLPTWVTLFALILFLAGLPVVLATAYVQRGPPGAAEGENGASGSLPTDRPRPVGEATPRRTLLRALTWRRALLGGVLAFSALVVTTGGYMGMRALGFGPFGTLMAAGVLSENDRIVLADFGAADGDAAAADIITQALRIDMLQSTAFGLVDPAEVRVVLTRMKRDGVSRLTEDLAREVALRGGYKIVLAGSAGRLGSGYVLTARLILPESGETYAAFRQTAASDDELLGAVDALSRKVRTRIGESLKSISASMPLAQVTSHSLEALMLYTTAERILVGHEPADGRNPVELLSQAIEIDSTFAMAHRKLGALMNMSTQRVVAIDAHRAAWRHRDRLPEVERRLAEGLYHWSVTSDPWESLAAHRRVLEIDPHNPIAHHNIMGDYLRLGQPERAIASGVVGLGIPNPYGSHLRSLGAAYASVGRWDDAMAVADTLLLRDSRALAGVRFKAGILTVRGEYDRADSLTAEVLSWDSGGLSQRGFEMRRSAAASAGTRGRLGRAGTHFDTLATLLRRHEFEPLVLRVEAARARQIAELTGDVERAGETLRRAVVASSDGLDDASTLNYPVLDIAMAFAAIGAAAEANEWLARQDSARPHEAIRKELQYELARLRLLTKAGHAREAIEELQRLGDAHHCQPCVAIQLAEAFDAASQPDSAAARYRMYIDSPHLNRIETDQFYLPRAHLRLAELLEHTGDQIGARRHYLAFTELWEDADPELQPVVSRARGRL